MTTTPHKGAAERQTQPPPFSLPTTMSILASTSHLHPQDSPRRRLGHFLLHLSQLVPSESQYLDLKNPPNQDASGVAFQHVDVWCCHRATEFAERDGTVNNILLSRFRRGHINVRSN
ncbi:hypothetical protein R3P38DRAFT_3350358, partial [Favolaschia claudopus]